MEGFQKPLTDEERAQRDALMAREWEEKWNPTEEQMAQLREQEAELREKSSTVEYASPDETEEFYLAFCDQTNEDTAHNRRLAAAAYAANAYEDGEAREQDEKEALALLAIETHNELGEITFKLSTAQLRLTKVIFNKYYLSLFPDADEETDNA